jgi:hypothetical protein
VALEKAAPPNGAHIHASRFKCNAFSCSAQSYLLLKRLQQNVQQKMRRSSCPSFDCRGLVMRPRDFLERNVEEFLDDPELEFSDCSEFIEDLLAPLSPLVDEAAFR